MICVVLLDLAAFNGGVSRACHGRAVTGGRLCPVHRRVGRKIGRAWRATWAALHRRGQPLHGRRGR